MISKSATKRTTENNPNYNVNSKSWCVFPNIASNRMLLTKHMSHEYLIWLERVHIRIIPLYVNIIPLLVWHLFQKEYVIKTVTKMFYAMQHNDSPIVEGRFNVLINNSRYFNVYICRCHIGLLQLR